MSENEIRENEIKKILNEQLLNRKNINTLIYLQIFFLWGFPESNIHLN